MKIYLLRHGAYSTENNAQLDVLTPNGIAQLKALCAHIAPLKIGVSAIYHSQKNRAKQSAEIIAKAVIAEQGMSEHPHLLPNDSVTEMVYEIEAQKNDLFIVGHLPFLGSLVSYLVLRNEHKQLLDFDTGTLVCLQYTPYKYWIIEWVIQPSLLKAQRKKQ